MAQADKAEYRGEIHQLQKELMLRWYERLDESARTGNTPAVSLMISGNCVELLEGFGILPIYPEVNALQLAIRHQSLEPILLAEELGYAADNCAYVKADIGALLKGITPTGGKLPIPALALCNFVGCNTYVKWFEHIAEFQKVPLYVLDVPFLRTDVPSKDDIAYVVRQLHELVKRLEEITGRKFDYDRFQEAVRYSSQVEELWSRIKHLSRRTPSPFDAYFDATTLMGPLYVYRGTADGVKFFRAALDEYEAMAARGEGPLEKEKFRLVLEGPPPYPFFRVFRDMFAKWGACAVASTYSTVGGLWEFGFRHDPEKPFEAVALHMLENNVTNRNYLQRYEQIRRYVEEWNAQGLIIHFVKSCRLFSAGQGDMRDYFTKELGVPTLYLESDLEDPRYFSEAQIKNRMDAFFESLGHAPTPTAAQLEARAGRGPGALSSPASGPQLKIVE